MTDDANHEDDCVPVEALFLTECLLNIRDLAELKIALQVAMLSARNGGRPVSVDDLLAPEIVRSVVGTESPQPGIERLRLALERAVSNGVLLRLTVRNAHGTTVYVLASTARNRELVRGAGTDEDSAAALNLSGEFEAAIYRPNAFAFYEQHIGPLTPLIAEQLRDAERSYPRQWIEESILEAVHYNRRSWRYIETVLKHREKRGAPDGIPSRHS